MGRVGGWGYWEQMLHDTGCEPKTQYDYNLKEEEEEEEGKRSI